METITLTDDKTRPNDQAMFPPAKVQPLFEITKLFGKKTPFLWKNCLKQRYR